MTTYYKILNEDRSAYHGGSGTWPDVGEWTEPVTGKLVPCRRGYHLFEPRHIVNWIGPALWEAEYEGEIVQAEDKVVVRKARLVRRVEAWNAKTLYLWAADCAERQLGNFETLLPEDKRPRQALDAVRGYAAGTVTLDDLNAAASAARSAAWSAASAAWSAASSAASAESAAASAAAAAESAAAAWSAAWSAASASAAWSAWSAAWSAAAASAAWSAESAARSAEIDWQTAHLLDLIGLGSEVPARTAVERTEVL